MKRGIAARSIAVLLAVFFASGSALPSFGDPCPVHDPQSAQLAMMSHGGHTPGEMSRRAAVHSSKHAHGDTGAPDNHGSHRCNCIGDGCCTASFMLVPNVLSFAPAIISARSTAPLAPAETRGRGTAEHALPFSTAPPLLDF